MASTTFTPGDPTGLDPAAAGDPFLRVRYRYGMLLGADELTLEQRTHLLHHRVHQALLHGAGTVWGLRVAIHEEHSEEIVVEPGWAVDALGREIFVPARQCLNIEGLTQHPLWARLAEVGPNQRRAWVVLRHQTCETQPVVAIRPACSEPSDAMPFSRVVDSFRIDLEDKAPPNPVEQLTAWLNHNPLDISRLDLEGPLVDLLTRPARGLASLWDVATEAPLLLASVDVAGDPTTGAQVVVTPFNPDNRMRPLLPPTWLSQHRGLQERGLRVVAISIGHPANHPEAHELRVELTGEVDSRTVGAVKVMELGENGWVELISTVSPEGGQLVVQPAGASSGKRFQISLVGAGPRPLMAADGSPLAGWLTDPPVREGQGRDVGFVGSWLMGGGE